LPTSPEQAIRQALEQWQGKREKFKAIFDKPNYLSHKDERGLTTLVQGLVHVDSGTYISNHLWVQRSESFQVAGCKFGDEIEFLAVVMSYRKKLPLVGKNDVGHVFDWGLSKPTAVKILTPRQEEKKPEDKIEMVEMPPLPLPELDPNKSPETPPAEDCDVDVLADLALVKSTAKQVGGFARLKRLIGVLE
jgi:hypothetical protein